MAKADAQATFAIALQDETSNAALSAQHALEDLRGSIDRDTKALASLQKQMKALQGGASVDIQAFRALKKQIDEKKDSISKAQAAVVNLGGSLDNVKRPTSGFKAALEALQKQAQGVGGPLGGVAGQFSQLKGLLAGGAVTLGIVAVGAALAALAVAAVAATGALFRYGLAQANARRSELLRLEGLTKMRSIWGIAAGNAKELQGSIDKVSASTSLGRNEVASYATSLYKAGLRGQNLQSALEGVAIKATTQGQEAANAFAGLATSIALTGGSVKKLSDNVKSRLGGIAQAQLLDLDVQVTKLHENFAALFAGVHIEPVLKAFKSIVDLFSQSTITGRALKAIVENIFTPIAAVVTFITPMVTAFFQGMVVGALQVTVGVLKLTNYLLDAALWIKKSFAGNALKGLSLTTAALWLGKAAVYAVAGGLALLVPLMTGLGIALTVAVVPILWSAVTAMAAFAASGLALAAPFVLGAAAIGLLGAAIYQLYDVWDEIDWSQLGTDILNGIVGGLKGAAGFLIDTMKGLASSALGSFKNALGIHSPSREFAKLGAQLPAGVEQGIAAGEPGLDKSVGDMVSVPEGGKGSTSTSRSSITIGNITIQTSATNAQGIAEDIREALEKVFSGMALEVGAPA